MWGPNVTFWEKLGDLNQQALATLESESDRADRFPVYDYFLVDRESAQDLQLTSPGHAHYGLKRGSPKKNSREETTLFVGEGLISLVNQAPRISGFARSILESFVLMPERTLEGIQERQKIFRILSTDKAREIKDLFAREADFNYNEFVQITDYIYSRCLVAESHEGVQDYLQKIAKIRAFFGIFGKISNDPELKDIATAMRENQGERFEELKRLLTSEKYTLQIAGDLTAESVAFFTKTPEPNSERTDILGKSVLSDREDYKESQTRRPELGLFSEFLLNLFRDNYKPTAVRFITCMAGLEACAYYADAVHSSREVDWCLPEIVESDEPFIEIDGFVHPMYLRDRKVMGNLRIGGDRLVNVITGANDSGKTQLLRGLGQIVYLAMAGFPIPATKARMSLINSIHTNFGGDDTAAKGRYKKALSRWMDIFRRFDKKSLILGDEPTDGTFVETGVKHGIKILNALSRAGIPTLVTTHYHDIASAVEAGKIPRAQNLHVKTKRREDGGLDFTRQITDGVDYLSYGEEVAEVVGFTDANLERVASGENLEGARMTKKSFGGDEILF